MSQHLYGLRGWGQTLCGAPDGSAPEVTITPGEFNLQLGLATGHELDKLEMLEDFCGACVSRFLAGLGERGPGVN